LEIKAKLLFSLVFNPAWKTSAVGAKTRAKVLPKTRAKLQTKQPRPARQTPPHKLPMHTGRIFISPQIEYQIDLIFLTGYYKAS
jgi:hypothetical protein